MNTWDESDPEGIYLTSTRRLCASHRYPLKPRRTAIRKQRIPTGAGLLAAASALAFGILGWVAAHGCSSWLLDHTHVDGAVPDVWRLDRHAGEVALFAACLAAGSLLALLAVPDPGRPNRPDRKRTTHFSAMVSVGAFLATDVTERVVAGGHPVPPFMVLLIGLAVYAAIGTGASLLWRYCLGSVRGVSALLERRHADSPHRRPEQPGRTATFRRRRVTRLHAGRSPPLTA